MTRLLSSRRKIAAFGIVWFAVALSGCTYFRPNIAPSTTGYCDNKKLGAGANDDAEGLIDPRQRQLACEDLSDVKQTTKEINAHAQAAIKKIDDNNELGRAMDLATFALGTAFAVKASHGTTISNGARNLALGAGASYVGGSLFASKSTNSLYTSAEFALICVADNGNSALAVYDQAFTQIHAAAPIKDCSGSDAAANQSKLRMQDSLFQAYGATKKVYAADGIISQMMRHSDEQILSNLEGQLQANAPQPAAFLGAGSTIITIANGLATGSQHPKSGGRPPPLTCTASADAFNAQANALDGVTQSLAKMLNGIQDSINSCTSQQKPATAPMVLSSLLVSLSPGASKAVALSGGQPPYVLSWTGAAPGAADVIAVIQSGGTADITILLLTQEKTFKTTGKYTLVVKDSSPIPFSSTLPVETAAN